MAQYTNFAALPTQSPDFSGYENILNNFVKGYQVSRMPSQMQEKAKMDKLQQQLAQAQVNMAPEQLKALQLQNKYYPQQQSAELALRQAQARAAGQPEQYAPTDEEKLIRFRNTLDPNSPDYAKVDAILSKRGSQSNGVTTSYDPSTGTYTTQVGGVAQNKPGQIRLDGNGQPVQNPTNAENTRIQRGLVSIDMVKPKLTELAKNLGQFQTGTADLGEKLGGLSNYFFHTDFKGPSEKAAGEAGVTQAAESLMGAFQLNSSGEVLQEMKDTIKPHFGESQKGYNDRIAKDVADLINRQIKLQNAAAGIPLSNVTNAKGNQPYSEKLYKNKKTGETLTESQMRQRGFL